MYCPNCGESNVNTATFCKKCGKEIGTSASSANVSQGMKRSILKRTVSTRWAFIIAIICFALSYLIPLIGLAGLLALIFGIITLIRDLRRRETHRWQNVGLLFIAFSVFILVSYLTSLQDLSSVPIDTSTPPPPTETDVILQADFGEGYNAGYVDGRSAEGNLGDNYAPPATEERNASYTDGYVAGFNVGCREGGFNNCTEILQALEEDQGITTAD